MNPLVHNSKTKIPNSEFRIPNLTSHSALIPSAFTLVELLIVIAIIGVLTAMSLSLLGSASNDAKVSATQARMSQIVSILQLQMEDYEVRRLPISNRILNQYVQANRIPFDGSTNAKNDRLQLKYLRRQVLMGLIDSEMPRPVRQFPDGQPIVYLENENAGQFPTRFNLTADSAFAQINQPKNDGEFGIAVNEFAQWIDENYGNEVSDLQLSTLLSRVRPGGAIKFQRQVDAGVDVNGVPIELDLPAEYLHEILRSIQIDGQSSVELLGSSAISDTDDDGFPEVVDAWGEPLLFDLEQFSATVVDNVVRSNSNGFVPLDPRYPMALGDLQIVVGSSRIPESLPVVERISRGLPE